MGKRIQGAESVEDGIDTGSEAACRTSIHTMHIEGARSDSGARRGEERRGDDDVGSTI